MASSLKLCIALFALFCFGMLSAGSGFEFEETNTTMSINATEATMATANDSTSTTPMVKTLVKRKISDSQWGQWSAWGQCSKSCGSGIQTRTRSCHGAAGKSCQGKAMEEKVCNTKVCPSWTEWSSWSTCSVTCGPNGQQTRTRKCQNGADCPNPNTNMEKRPCSPQPPVCAKWNDWSVWTTCSKTCGGGEQSRTRMCVVDNPGTTMQPTKVSSATSCPGPNRETQKCNTQTCPLAKWTPWSAWSACSATCGSNGKQMRKRTCTGGTTCVGPNQEEKPCAGLKPCDQGRWSEWQQWGQCSKMCGGGEQTRQRTCIDGKQDISHGCSGSDTSKRPCNAQQCPTWTEWSFSGACSVTCGNGVRKRTRTCTGGMGCIGASDEFVTCTNPPCKF